MTILMFLFNQNSSNSLFFKQIFFLPDFPKIIALICCSFPLVNLSY